MTKIRWAAMGLMLFGAYVVQAFGCSSSPAAVAATGGACCACSVSDSATGCSNSKTLKPLAPVTDCNSFCAGQTLAMCPGAAAPTIGGTGVACPGALGEAGTTVTVDGSIVHPTGEGGVALGDGDLGSQCTKDAECQTGFVCSKPADDLIVGTGSGYPNGICTVDCSADPTMCTPLRARCVSFDPDPNAVNPKAICLEGCTVGSPATGAVKCHNRGDQACSSVGQSGGTACVPLCATDADCAGRKCDGATGLCTDKPTTGDPLGSPCMANTATTTCAGQLCLALVDSVQGGPPVPGLCSGVCVLGALEGCGWRRTPVAGGPAVGTCWAPLVMNGGLQDIGFCLPLCDVDGDCPKTQGAMWICDHTIPGVDMTLNHGACQILDPDAAPPAGG
jgi:hypothetical protein